MARRMSPSSTTWTDHRTSPVRPLFSPCLVGDADRLLTSIVAVALMELYGLGATDDKGHITKLGKQMAALPLEPRHAKCLLASFERGCPSNIIDLLALLDSADSLLSVPFQHREKASEVRSKFIHRDGDHMMLLNILKAFEEVCQSISEPKERKAWCSDHFLSLKTLNQVLDTRKQLRDRINRLDPTLDCNLSSQGDDSAVLSCLLEGHFANTAMRMQDGSYRRTSGTMVGSTHPFASVRI